MVDLKDVSGLPLEFDPDTYALRSTSSEWSLPEPGLRKLDDMRVVLRDPCCKGPDVVYWMYRDLALPEHAGLKDATGLRYDISVFRGEPMGSEVFKTSGHYHPYIDDAGKPYNLSWPEVYEVLYGEAIYLLQKVDNIYSDCFYGKVEDFIVVRAKPGQKVVMPPNYGHVTLNPNPGKPLVMCNWVCNWFKSYYESVEQAKGFGWWRVLKGKGKSKKAAWVPNPSYRQPLAPVRKARTLSCEPLGLCEGKPMYPIAAADPARFEWVCKPQYHLEEIWASLDLR
jgi:glucose-6-phosphate isomerase